MTGQTIILYRNRDAAHRLVEAAPTGAVLNIKPPTRTTDQNALLWSLISDISRAKPQGRVHTPDVWKSLLMSACGHAVQFENGLNGQPFPIGFRSSRLTKVEMSELIEFTLAWGIEQGVTWSRES